VVTVLEGMQNQEHASSEKPALHYTKCIITVTALRRKHVHESAMMFITNHQVDALSTI
jgi:hypothetical protein